MEEIYLITKKELAGLIDHTLLKPNASEYDVARIRLLLDTLETSWVENHP